MELCWFYIKPTLRSLKETEKLVLDIEQEKQTPFNDVYVKIPANSISKIFGSMRFKKIKIQRH
jgi:hypothetical protein